MTVAIVYILIFVAAYLAWRFWQRSRESAHDYTSLKTVTFGDEFTVSGKPLCLGCVGHRPVCHLGRIYRIKDHADSMFPALSRVTPASPTPPRMLPVRLIRQPSSCAFTMLAKQRKIPSFLQRRRALPRMMPPRSAPSARPGSGSGQ